VPVLKVAGGSLTAKNKNASERFGGSKKSKAKKQNAPMIVGAWFSTRESVYQLLLFCQGKYSTIFIFP
jgi:hypothetical protein